MNLVIKEKAYQDVGIAFEQLCYLLSLKNRPSKKDFQDLIDRKMIIISSQGQINLGGRGFNTVVEVLRLSQIVHTDFEVLQELAKKMADLFPAGKKPGTSKYWKGNSSVVVKKLNSFLKKYGIIPPDTIIKATSAYVNSFGADKSLMRILPYFIEKDGESDLLTFIENLNDNEEEDLGFEDENLL